MSRWKHKCMLATSLTVWLTTAWTAEGFGTIGDNLFVAIQGISGIIHIICGATGAALILSAFFRYFTYRRNPVVAPLSSVITLLVTGLCLVALIFIPIGSA